MHWSRTVAGIACGITVLGLLIAGFASGLGASTAPANLRGNYGRSIAATVTGTISPGGPAVPVTISTAGDNAVLIFDGTATQRVSVLASNSTISMYSVKLVGPSGTLVNNGGFGTGGAFVVDATVLPTTGSYSLYITPTWGGTGSVTITLYNVPPDVSEAITPGGSPVSVSMNVPGQNALLSFVGYEGQRVSVAASGSTVKTWYLTLRNPDGSKLVGTGGLLTGSTYPIDTTPLPGPGTYSLFINPAGSFTGSVTITLYDVPPDFSGAISPGGAAVSASMTVPGQNGQLSFSGTTGQRVSVAASGSTIKTWYLTVRNPDGSKLVGTGGLLTGSTFAIDTTPLPGPGTYTLFIDPAGSFTGSVNLTLYDVPPDFNAPITPNGPPVTVTTTVPGQNGRLTFDGTAGQRLSLHMTNSTIGNFTTVSIWDPNGARIAKGDAGAGSVNYVFLDNVAASATGAYSIKIDPVGALKGQITATLSATPGGTVRITGLANLGETLAASLDWVDPPATLGATYQWQRCDAAGTPTSCVDLEDVGETHLVTPPDVGQTVRVVATLSNSVGSTTLTSSAVRILVDVQSLALLFRPHLFFDTNEHWRPLDVPSFLSEVFSDGGVHRLCWNASGDCKDIPQETDFASPYTKLDINGSTGDPAGFYTPYSCDKPGSSYDCDKGPDTVLYYEPTRDPVLEYLYIDFWFFYRYNLGALPTGDHEGDWEGMTVVIDPTGPPNNTGGPVVSYVLYAAHDGSSWSSYLGSEYRTHPDGYVGEGTHSTNPVSCIPSQGDNCGLLEVSYDGAYSWGRNVDEECGSTCVARFDSLVWPWWNWGGQWGINDEGSAPGGGSPPSPGIQGRFRCAQGGYGSGCPTPPFAGSPAFKTVRPTRGDAPSIGGPAGAASICASWEGQSSALTVCQPSLLRTTIRQGAISVRVKPNLKVVRFRGRIVAAKGITQAIGQPLVVGQRATIEGPLQAGSELAVRVRDHHGRWIAWFKLPRLNRGASARILVEKGVQHPTIRVRLPNREVHSRYFARDG
jgi:hypothetical protein